MNYYTISIYCKTIVIDIQRRLGKIGIYFNEEKSEVVFMHTVKRASGW